MKSSILYIDDEYENLESFRLAFWKFYDIELALSTKKAEELLKDKTFELIISDQKMSNETGLEFIHRIKPLYPKTVFILVTAYSDIDVVINAINTGIHRYIQKPWIFNEMKLAIDNALEKHQLRKKNDELMVELQVQNRKLATLNEQLAMSIVEAKESDRLKSAILSNISHEIRTPMNAIIGFSEMLIKNDIPKNKKPVFATIVKDSSARLLRVIDNILTISRLEIDELDSIEEPVCTNDLIMELYFLFIKRANRKKLKLIMHKALTDNDSTIMTDKLRLVQIFNNLIDNAIKFTSSGKIEIGYSLEKEFLQFFVKDNGIGIPDGMHSKVFESFYQVEMGNSRKFDGIGAGLHISKKLSELLGGKLWLISKPEKGSTFYFTVPYKKTENSEK